MLTEPKRLFCNSAFSNQYLFNGYIQTHRALPNIRITVTKSRNLRSRNVLWGQGLAATITITQHFSDYTAFMYFPLVFIFQIDKSTTKALHKNYN